MKAELEYTEPWCSVCSQDFDLVCEDCRRIFGEVIIRSESVTFHCHKEYMDEDGGEFIHLCDECNEKREKEKEQ